jgi:molybdate-binding protein
LSGDTAIYLSSKLLAMKRIGYVHSFEHIKLLADPRRLEILRILMAAPATLTQLAHIMGQSPAWVRHHILALESSELVEPGEIRKIGRVTEKYYRAKSDALLLQEIILPKTKTPALIFSGSHDLAFERVAQNLSDKVTLLTLASGSLDGLVNLRQGLCQISGAHLHDETGEYNTPFVRHLFPDRDVELITFAYRTQGLMIAKGNPRDIRRIVDLARPGIRFVNRNPGSGTRLWLDSEFRKLNVPTDKINGYDMVVNTHSAAAALISAGKADVALGQEAAAHENSLDFIPLFDERYDLVFPGESIKTFLPLLDYLQTSAFRTDLSKLTGYNSRHSGEQIPF